MRILSPTFKGKAAIKSPGPAFLQRFKERVEAGLLMNKPHRRSRYAVTRHSERELAFRATDIVTAINVGLNDVELRAAASGGIEYSVSYRRWTAYVVGLGAVLALGFLIAFLFGDLGSAIDRYALVPGQEPDGNPGMGVFWGFVLFWTVFWPWILVILHRPFARKLLERIIAEVDRAAAQPSTSAERKSGGV